MSLIKTLNIDLNINKNFVSFLQFFKNNTLTTLEEIDSNLSSIDDHYNNNIGHSHTFSEIVKLCLSSFQNFTSVDSYLNYQLPSLIEYSVWKPIFHRDLNYNNEQSFLDNVILQTPVPLLKLRQVLFYFSLIWVHAPITTFDDSNHDFSVVDYNQKVSTDDYYKGVLNFMDVKQKKYFLNSFNELKNNFEEILSQFQSFYEKLTKRNENLNSVRNSFSLILILLRKIYHGFQNAKDELVVLLAETQEDAILEIPNLTIDFRNQIEEIAALLLELHNEINTVLTRLS